MKISTKGRHAITAMMELALRSQQGPVTLADISSEQSISVSYLEQLFARLRGSGLVTGMRGPGGGYKLRRPATEISVAEILYAIDDAVHPTENASLETARKNSGSLLLWDRLSSRIYDYLDGISLADAVELGHGTSGGPNPNKGLSSSFQRSAA